MLASLKMQKFDHIPAEGEIRILFFFDQRRLPCCVANAVSFKTYSWAASLLIKCRSWYVKAKSLGTRSLQYRIEVSILKYYIWCNLKKFWAIMLALNMPSTHLSGGGFTLLVGAAICLSWLWPMPNIAVESPESEWTPMYDYGKKLISQASPSQWHASGKLYA